jgi:hypothetical protein
MIRPFDKLRGVQLITSYSGCGKKQRVYKTLEKRPFDMIRQAHHELLRDRLIKKFEGRTKHKKIFDPAGVA